MIDRKPTNQPIVVLKDYREPPAAGKKVTLNLMWGDFAKAYRVITITNTTWYQPKMWLSVEIVSKICELPNWEVSMVGDDMIKNILGFAEGKLPGIAFPIIP